ncbi:MAG TPA: TIGR04053 family radical SAM/SPASM domain-containing protein [Candidatus Angelobacter sp.]
MNANFDLNQCPLIVIWETTQACDLACCHCRACAQPVRHPLELTTKESEKLIRDVADLRPPIFILTGGDPLKRPDIYDLVRYASAYGLHPAMTPSATPLLTKNAIAELKRCGLSRLAVSLDGSVPELHDVFRGVPGSYSRTLEAIQWANECGVPIQVNTSIYKRNIHDLENMAELLKHFKLVLWSIFFLVPTGRGQLDELPSAEEFEQTFAKLYKFSQEMPYKIKTTEAQHYRRFILQQRAMRKNIPVETLTAGGEKSMPGLLPINDGKGFVFVSHIGEVYPSGFLPISAGSVRKQNLTEIYQKSELLVGLRDRSNLQGKCGECEFNAICGGSRARAYAMTGNIFAEDPCCSYIPKAIAEARSKNQAFMPIQSI